MFCPKCGKQLNDNAKFCTDCGTPISVSSKSDSLNETDLDKIKKSFYQDQVEPSANKKPSKKIIIAVICIVCIAIFAIIIIQSKESKTDVGTNSPFNMEDNSDAALENDSITEDSWISQAFEVVDNNASCEFATTEIVTREEGAYLLSEIVPDKIKKIDFADVEKENKYYTAVSEYGAYMGGRSIIGRDNYFYPTDPLLREDIAVGLFYLLDLEEGGWKCHFADFDDFTEDDGTSSNYRQAACAMVNIGIMNMYEDSCFSPKSTITRGEIVQLLENLRESGYPQNPSNASAQDVKMNPADGEQNLAFETSENGDELVLSTAFYSITVPRDWGETCLYDYEYLSNGGNSLTLYEKQSYYDGYGGALFTILLWPKIQEYDYMECTVLGTLSSPEQGSYRIIVQYPTDVQFSDAGMDQYMSLQEHIDSVLDSFYVHDGVMMQSETDTDIDYWYDSQYIDPDSLSNATRDDIVWARNEIYARHGYIFQRKDIQEAFEAMEWYEPNPNYSDDLLNNIERGNLETLIAYERQMGWRE